jgi:hypothetical protein
MWENLFVVATQFATFLKIIRFNQYVFSLKLMLQLYKKGVFYYVSHKNICAYFGWVKKKLTLKTNILNY